jgi:hypothetical protein
MEVKDQKEIPRLLKRIEKGKVKKIQIKLVGEGVKFSTPQT